MQDIGGCRAIVKNIEQLKALRERLVKADQSIRLLKSQII